MTEEESSPSIVPSRRSFMKKGALASGALALGTAGAGSAAAQQQQNALVFSYEFFPGATFRVAAPLQTSTTIDILDGPGDQGVPEISQPDEYNGHVISYQIGGSAIYTFAFTRDQALQQDTRYRFGDNSQVFSSRLNLLQVPVQRAAAGGGGQTATPTPQS